MKKFYMITIMVLSIVVNSQEAGKVGELLQNEATNSEMKIQENNSKAQSQEYKKNNTTNQRTQNSGTIQNQPNGKRGNQISKRRIPQYHWNQNIGYSEVFVRIPEGGYFSIEVDNQMMANSSGKFRFFDLPAGRLPISIYENGFLVYRTHLSIRNNSRMVLDYFTQHGLYLLHTMPISSNSYGFVQWDDVWNDPYYGNGGFGNNNPRGTVMNNQEFNQFLSIIDKTNFDSSKIELIQHQSQRSNFTSQQIKTLMNLFSFDSKKLEIGKGLYGKCIDPQNFFQVYEVFSFDSNRKELMKFVDDFR